MVHPTAGVWSAWNKEMTQPLGGWHWKSKDFIFNSFFSIQYTNLSAHCDKVTMGEHE